MQSPDCMPSHHSPYTTYRHSRLRVRNMVAAMATSTAIALVQSTNASTMDLPYSPHPTTHPAYMMKDFALHLAHIHSLLASTLRRGALVPPNTYHLSPPSPSPILPTRSLPTSSCVPLQPSLLSPSPLRPAGFPMVMVRGLMRLQSGLLDPPSLAPTTLPGLRPVLPTTPLLL